VPRIVDAFATVGPAVASEPVRHGGRRIDQVARGEIDVGAARRRTRPSVARACGFLRRSSLLAGCRANGPSCAATPMEAHRGRTRDDQRAVREICRGPARGYRAGVDDLAQAFAISTQADPCGEGDDVLLVGGSSAADRSDCVVVGGTCRSAL
jgi:hypothetical protein